jgi:Ca2+-binding RTX toxin-like protein
MNAAFFRAGAHALDGNDFVIYNRATGALLYDPNGNAAGGEVQFALFVNKPVLTASEFAVV